MASIPWRAAAMPSWRRTLPTASARPHIYRRLYTECRRPKTACSLRVPLSSTRSRAFIQLPFPRLRNHTSPNGTWRRWVISPTDHIQPLESRFPIKTIIAVLVAGGIGYFLGSSRVEINDLGYAFSPLFLFKSREEVDSFITDITALLSIGPLPNSQGGRGDEPYGDAHGTPGDLELGKDGWMSPRDSMIKGIPLTHGFDTNANGQSDDFFSVGAAPGPGSDEWIFWGIYDGHNGGSLAASLHTVLFPVVSQALSTLPLSASSPAITNAIMQAFVREDQRIMTLAQTAAAWHPALSPGVLVPMAIAMSGSCALLSMYDPKRSMLRVANVGDSRAVLGRWDEPSGSYSCIPLSVDQTGSNPDEVSRIKEAHPGEDDMLDTDTGRLLGLPVTRAFGDHRWKWTDDLVLKVKAKFFGPEPLQHSKTPPYITAEPVVQEMEIVSVDAEEEKRRGSNARSDFLIMASRELWERMSSEDAVLLVQRWLEARERGNGQVLHDPQLPERLQVEWEKRVGKTMDEVIGYNPEKVGGVSWRATPEFFAIEDENAAVCLYRNLIGGTRRWLQAGIRWMPLSFKKNAIHDTMIMVVFFDKTGAGVTEKQDNKVTAKAKSWYWPWFSPWHVPDMDNTRRGG